MALRVVCVAACIVRYIIMKLEDANDKTEFGRFDE